jgi:hypothetical protein
MEGACEQNEVRKNTRKKNYVISKEGEDERDMQGRDWTIDFFLS